MESSEPFNPSEWNVRSMQATALPRYKLWHCVVSVESLTWQSKHLVQIDRCATTKCGLHFYFPTPSAVFTRDVGEDNICQECK